jgi:tRNA U34 5-methylaminomethyl-2-thiouridine-forming methyltransferase MnmC
VLQKLLGKAQEMMLPENYFDVVYFDAFAPDVQPEMWTKDMFFSIYRSMKAAAVLTTYSTKGDVKRALKEVGFTIEKLAGPKGKREILRALKTEMTKL